MPLKDTVKYIVEAINSGAANLIDFANGSSETYRRNTRTWRAKPDGKTLELEEDSVREENFRARDSDGNPLVDNGDEFWITSYVDFADVNYYSIAFKSIVHKKSTRASLKSPNGGAAARGTLGIETINESGEETLYEVSFGYLAAKALKVKTQHRRTDGFDTSDKRSSTQKVKGAQLSFTVQTERDARRLVNAMKHAVVMGNGGRIPPPPAQPAPANKPDPFDK